MYVNYYEGEHNVLFGETSNQDSEGYVEMDLDMWKDLKLIPSSRPVIAPPLLETKSIEVLGAYGDVDLSTFLTGYPIYRNREGSIEFIIADQRTSWIDIYTTLLHKFHGKKLNLVLTDEPDYYYNGRFTIEEPSSERSYTKIVINYILYPTKFSRESKDIVITGSESVSFYPTDKLSSVYFPDIILATNNPEYQTTFKFLNEELNIYMETYLRQGTNRLGSQVVLSNFSGKNKHIFNVNTNGTVTIKYRENRL